MDHEPAVTGIVESSLYVDDLRRAVQFYQDIFGFSVEIQDDLICVLRVPGRQALILFPKRIADEPGRTTSPAGTVEGIIPSHGGSGRLHLTFGTAMDELPAWERKLKDHGVRIEGKVVWKRGGTSIYFRDPDGHLLELITPGVWSFF